jgi:hypothetical protein
MPDWSIKFVPAKVQKPGVLADFVLDNPGDPPGPFNVFQADNVSWDNATQDDHWPAVYAPGAGPPAGVPVPIGDQLEPGDSSDTYSIPAPAGSTILFCCKLHPNEVGTFKVIAPGTTPSV